ncbi:putative secreted protein (Por secretion system target) [Flavobacterium cutihirudinis]|uniref:Putative secreted protein (Por secretion system target) n=1 Tax=Flavobacterium cutihirudinis TaxID=1265740 RepID=A0A3D9FRK6_9FLAO|nr:MBG domain-containing protein [Flavobacterium cutihirudinis]RED23252.1 putative secreted protein (Por secretion system target) [Flavobacterium cutihirudinis]
MKKKLHLIFTFIFVLFASANMFGQLSFTIDRTDMSPLSPLGSLTVNIDEELFPPYRYSWSTGETTKTISDLIEGNEYSVTVFDDIGQMNYASITVMPCLGELEAIAVQTNSSCGGAVSGSATVAVKGGTGYYRYKWNTEPAQLTQSVTGLAAGTYTVTATDIYNGCSTTGSVNISLNPTTPVGDPTVFGDNVWNVYAWNEGTYNSLAWQSDYSGYFTASGLNFNSEDYFADYDVPSSVPGYQGCKVNGDNHSWSAKRQGFPCGYYTIDIPMHDDWIRLYVNGQLEYSDDKCCEGHTNVWHGFLDSNSTVEFRIAEERGQSRGNIKFNLIEPTAAITNVRCYGGSNGEITLTLPTNDNYTYDWGNGITTQNRTGLTAGDYTVAITTPTGCIVNKTYTVSGPEAFVITPTKTNPTCNGDADGSISVSVTGGTGAYDYSWSPSGGNGATASGLRAGTYTVTVTDANYCSITESFAIKNPEPIVISKESQTNVACYGANTGSVTVSATGGTGLYTYKWSPSGGDAATASGLKAGTYTVTITDENSCTATKSFTIEEPLNPLAASQGTIIHVNCHGEATGSATVNVTGGTGSYSYAWSPSGGVGATATELTAGDYRVTITDENGCTAIQDFTIDQPGSVLSATTASVGVSCFGGANGSASVAVSGGSPSYSYSWAPSGGTGSVAYGLAAGNYTCTITDAKGCTLVETVEVDGPEKISGTIVKTDVSCSGGTNGSATVTPSGGVGSYTYVWVPTGGNEATASGLSKGTYTVTITDGNSCTGKVSVIIDEPAPLTLSFSKTDVLCNGGATGTATAVPVGGSKTYSYLWSPSGGTAATAIGLKAGIYNCKVTDSNGCFVIESVTIGEPAALSASTSQINATCASGGQAVVSVSGGVSPYSYLWSSGQTSAIATGLAAGSYSCVITDANGCTLTKNVFITTTNTLVAITSQNDILCNGAHTGSATVVASGTPGPFTYVWSPTGGSDATASSLAAGNYSVLISAGNGCSIVKNFTIIEPSALAVTPSQTNLLCHGATTGSASVVVTGGTGLYTYKWSPSGGNAATASGLSAGTYTVTVSDENDCTTTQSFTITEPDALVASVGPQTNIACHGGNTGSASVVVTGGTGLYTYKWSPSGGNAATASGLSAGTYTVTVSDENDCTTTQSFTITEPDALVASVGPQTNIACHGGNTGSATVNVSGGTGLYKYSWSPSGGNAATASGLSAGIYTVTVSDENDCTATQSFTITEPDALVVSVGPQTNIACHGGNTGSATVNVTGGTGLYTYKWSPSGGNAATASGLSAGIYTVTVSDEKNCTATQSFTITEPKLLEAVTSKTNVSCYKGNDGTASVNVSGGIEPYVYLWSSKAGNKATATGLAPGTYSVTITDANSCSITKTVEIEEGASFAVNTLAASNITVSEAVVSGTISSETNDGKCLTETGFVYSLKANPLITDSKIVVGSTLGSISTTLVSLKGNTNYYVKAYAINSNGFVTYGNEISFTTDKYTLTVTASAEHQKVFGTTDPVFGYTVSGLVNGDTKAIVTGALSREAGENVGKYNIQGGTIDAGKNYKIAFKSAAFEIIKADQVIFWNQVLEIGCESENNINLNAVSNSGLPITYSVENTNIAEVSGNNLAIKKSGYTSVTASQNGDQNHNPALSVLKPVEVTQSGLIKQHWSDVLFFDNKNKDFVSWQWYKNGTAISGATQQYFKENQALYGNYYVVATDKDGNKIKSCLFQINGIVFSNSMKIYPNPVKWSSEFTLECNFSEAQLKDAVITIFDINGKLVQTVSNVKTQNQIIAPSQTAIYIVLLTLSNGEQKTINLLVK